MDYRITDGAADTPVSVVSLQQPDTQGSSESDVSFGDTLKSFLSQVNNLQQNADEKMREFAAGNIQNAHAVFVAAEEAGLALRMAIQLRDRIISAYTEVLHMTV